MVSNRVKRNFSVTLLCIGLVCIISRAWDVALSPESAKTWLKLIGIIVITYLCYDNFNIYQRRIKRGILFGDQKQNSNITAQ